MLVGYIRVSTAEQNTVRQEVLMESLGVEILFIDKASGKNAERPELIRMMEFVRQGDTIVVESISRFARNTRDLLELVERLTAKGVEFVSKKESIDTSFFLSLAGFPGKINLFYPLTTARKFIIMYWLSGCGEVWYRAWFGSMRPRVRIPPLRPKRKVHQ